jgi:hypothetical protein
MNLLLVFFSLFYINKTQLRFDINILHKIYEKLRLPIWHKNNIKCETDEDCPIPFACCYDAFFPIKDTYCCTNYKKREYKYSYNYIK